MWSTLLAKASRLRFILARRRLSDEAALELQSHLELLTARYVASGLSPDEARRAAQRQLGNVLMVREEIYEMNSVRWLETLNRDVRSALRAFVKNPGFALVVIATLALGIGATTAILSVVYSVLIRPLPYPQPEQLHNVEVVVQERADAIPSLPPTIQVYLGWRSARTVFSGLAALTPWEASITGDGEPERLGGAQVSSNFFTVLGVPVALGRGFAPEEEVPGREHVVVISDGLWRRRYGADPGVIGRTVAINGQNFVVVGVAASSLLVPTGTELHPMLQFAPRVDIWKPIAPTARELEGESWDYGVVARLPDPANLERGRQQLDAILTDILHRTAPDAHVHVFSRTAPIREVYTGNVRLRLLLVLGASALLLLTACVSTANVLLARAASQSHEFATRMALGASRARILSQTLTETMVLAIAGGAVGALIARSGVGLLTLYGPHEVRLLAETTVSVPFLMFALMVSLLTGVVCGLVPAWQVSRRATLVDLKESARAAVSGRQAGRVRQILVGLEMALATVLLASSALLLQSFVNVMNADRGYDVERVLTADLSLFGSRYDSGEARIAFYQTLVANLRALPGVVAAGAINNLPAASVSDGASQTIFRTSDTDEGSVILARPVAMIRSVTAGYFSASGTPLRAGRLLADTESAPAAVISESLARKLWPASPVPAAVGRQLRQGGVTRTPITVVGIVADARPGGMDREPPPAIYRPYPQWASGPMTLVVRSREQPAPLSGALRAEVAKLDQNLPVAAIRTMTEIVSSTVAQRRFQMLLTSLFAVLALVLGAVGVYGVVSYAVACRTKDIGLRMALGALRADVMRWVFATGMWPVLIGLGSGLAGAVAAAGVFRRVLFGVTPTDPYALGAVVSVLLVASGLACYVPARRAASVDPMQALRSE